MKDCIVVGGGPAGLTAALYLARFLRSVTVFDAQEGRARMIPKTHNMGPFPDGISGLDLLDRMRSHAQTYGAIIKNERVSHVSKENGVFQVTTKQGVEEARCVIFAVGVFNHRPPLLTADHDQGLSRGLLRYCPVCDAYEVRGKRIAVLGSGQHGLAEAQFIRPYSPTVTLVPADGSVAQAKDGISALDSPMTELELSETHVLVKLKNGNTEQFDTLYVALGSTARSDIAASLGVQLAANGCIITDTKQRTNVGGVYAIGDITDGLDQVSRSMGQAAMAATTVHNDFS
ncbi:MAG TPA: NAD(P)/FAD-dependent oxidoreductase [Roseobacter sp.]|uniref:FAD/NAD(P)-binding domain-containing protein n=1 Tax=marine sediment metagenome TaxID=412755 RepID=A0A0F9TJL7_9ZZZZ|nr:NAD(P)/FAD-dependent oxidoreductase [Roseobacter sp.]|tara:strand:+ start:347 stop:1210 length:864 start_codon:yes stop_codon:yes gene_type:complete